MSDKELLELAAKAAGIEGCMELDTNFLNERWHWIIPYDNQGMISGFEWNPLTDDGDAFRLAVKLKINTEHCLSTENSGRVLFDEFKGNDPYAATRQAIVLAAAEIGKEMK